VEQRLGWAQQEEGVSLSRSSTAVWAATVIVDLGAAQRTEERVEALVVRGRMVAAGALRRHRPAVTLDGDSSPIRLVRGGARCRNTPFQPGSPAGRRSTREG